ncbi:MAG: polymer-forming cytoskeletal protein [Longimicrobiales bacterium]
MLGKRAKGESDAESDAVTTGPVAGQVSVIAKGMRVVGDCEIEGAVRIEGAVTGSVRARRVDLTESGHVFGDVLPVEGGGGGEVVQIGGQVGGTVRATEVEVRRGGSVAGSVNADRATIQGRVGGGIVVRDRLSLGETAVVAGEIQAKRLTIKEGGLFDGAVRMTGGASSPVPAVAVPA